MPVLVRGKMLETLPESEHRFHELMQAWETGSITYRQFYKAYENKWTLEKLLWWESATIYEKLKLLFNKGVL
jgi:hypothetical protein